MKLIDATPIIEKYKDYESYTYSEYDWMIECLVEDIIEEIKELPTIDPVHAANTCYCKECWYYTEWGECKEFGDIMKPDEFCSRGVIKNDKTY